jgi:hypothetical protein
MGEYRTNIYCSKNQPQVIADAIRHGLRVYDYYPILHLTSFDIISRNTSTEIARQNNFLSLYENDPNVMIYYNQRHPKCVKNPFRVAVKTKQTVGRYVTGVPDIITPITMKNFYSVPTFSPFDAQRPKIAVISLGGYYQATDLDYFWTNVCQFTVIKPTVTDHVVGDVTLPTLVSDYDEYLHVISAGYIGLPLFTPAIESLENTLDIELIGGFCQNADIHFYSTSNTYSGYKNAFIQAILDGMNIISTSWGQAEGAFYGQPLLLQDFDQVFAQAVSQGIVITAAGGDYGSSDNLTKTYNIPPYGLVPVPNVDFPASSPNVVACGGTSLFYDTVDEETTWIFGGGGQSAFFQRPSWQGPWPPTWPIAPLAYGAPFNPFGHTSGIDARTIPDISYNADPNSPWLIQFDGTEGSAAGTSACSPIMAGILGLYYTNAAPGTIIRAGYAPSGFNYYLYAAPVGIRTINFGNNVTVERRPITREINPFGQFGAESDTFYAVFDPVRSLCSGLGAIVATDFYSFVNQPVCTIKGTLILMANGQHCPIEKLERGQLVRGYQNQCYQVARVNRQYLRQGELVDFVEFTPNSLGQTCPANRLMLTNNHPIFFKGARRPAKCFKLLPNIIEHHQVPIDQIAPLEDDQYYCLYDLQFDNDGSYIAEGLVLQSRSPWSNLTPLPKDLYFDVSIYSDQRHWDSLNHTLPINSDILLP